MRVDWLGLVKVWTGGEQSLTRWQQVTISCVHLPSSPRDRAEINNWILHFTHHKLDYFQFVCFPALEGSNLVLCAADWSLIEEKKTLQ